MRVHIITLLLGLTEAVFVSENVIFHKTNEISTSRAKWLATFVIDLQPFTQFINKLENDIELAAVTAKCIVSEYKGPNKTEYLSTFEALQKELHYLNGSRQHIVNGLLDYKLLHSRHKRGLFNFFGDVGKFLFGLVTADDLEKVQKNIASLAHNQQKIMHVVEESLSILNMTRMEVSENRQAIMDLVKSVHALDGKLAAFANIVQREIRENRYFLEMYLKLDLIINEIKDMIQNGMFYLEHLKTQLNFLSLGRLSQSIISPSSLRPLLIDIKSHLPTTLTLIADPIKDLFLFYRQLSTSALLADDQIIIILSIPVLHISSQFEIYRAHSLPLPVKNIQTDNIDAPDLTAVYELEADGLMIDKGRTKYALLTKSETDSCSDPSIKWCSIAKPIFPVNLARLCLVNMFLKNEEATKKYCRSIVTLNTRLPLGEHLYDSVWAIASQKELQFSIVCQTGARETINIKPPVGLLKIPNACIASNSFMTLNSYYEIKSSFDLPDNNLDLLRHINISQTKIWLPLVETLPNSTKLPLPKALQQIPRIPLTDLINKMHYMQQVKRTTSTWPLAAYIGLGLGIIMIILIGRVLYKKYGKSKKNSLCSVLKRPKCKSSPDDTVQQTVQIGSTNVEGLQLTSDGCIPSNPVTTQNDFGMIQRLYPALNTTTETTRL